MNRAKLFTDEDIYATVAPALRKSGLAISTPEAGRLGMSDEAQLIWAANEGRTIVTFNVAHFAALHVAWADSGKHHAGIVVSSQRPVGDLLRRLMNLATTLDAIALCDRLEFLSDW